MSIPVLVTDLVLVLIIFISAIVGLKRGFVKSIAGFAEYIVAFMVANRFYTAGANLVAKIPFIANMITDVEMPTLDADAGFFGKIGAIISYILENSALSGTDPTEQAQAVINNYLAELISKAIAFIVLFIATVLLMKLIVLLIDKFCDLPVFNFTNRTLGVIFGLLCGMFITWILSNVFVNNILPILIDKYPETFTDEIKDSVVIKFFMKFSPVALVMYLANLVSSAGVK